MRFLRIAAIVILSMGGLVPLQAKAKDVLMHLKTINPHWHTNLAIYGDGIVLRQMFLTKSILPSMGKQLYQAFE